MAARMSIARMIPNRREDLALWALGLLVLLSIAGFGVYYYFDRYVHPDEKLLDRQAQHIEGMIAKNPQDPDLRANVAAYYVDGGLLDLAIQQCQEALKISPDHQGALLVLGTAYEKKGDLASAAASLEKLLTLKKEHPLAGIDTALQSLYYRLGTLYDRQGQTDKAIGALKAALDIDRTDADARYVLGTLYQKQGDHDAAVREFLEALRFDPFFDKPYGGLSASYAALGRPDEAAYAKGMVSLAQGNPSQAASQLEAVVAKSPDMVPAYFGLGLANEQLGKRDQAKDALGRFLAANPNDMAARQAMARLSQEVKP